MTPGTRSCAGRDGARRLAVSLTLLLVAVAVVVAGCGGKGATSDGKGGRTEAGAARSGPSATKYACPMDPEITSDRPGQRCPKCGMFLQPATAGVDTEPSDTAKADGKAGARDAVQKTVAAEKASGKQLYICPMHPTYVSDHPGDCPICGMRLVPAEQVSAGQEGIGIPGMAAIRLTLEGIRLAGVQTAMAEHGSVARTIRTVGFVSADESRVRRVQVKVEGYLERLFVNTPGQAVRKGDPLLMIYSPDLLAGQEEFLRAIEARKSLGGTVGALGDLPASGTLGPDQDRWRDADLLVRAARERLQLLDVPDDVLEQLKRTGKPTRTITLRSPASGVVTERMAYEGMKVMPGMELFTITDLSEAWIEGSFYESEAPFVAAGRRARLTLAYDPSVVLQGTVRFVYPYLDPQSRTLRARFSFPNTQGVLKPGMYANVTMEVEVSDGLLIPDNAVMDTGERKIVFVSKRNGLFEPRSVETGLRAEGKVQVLAGVMAGEEVVVRANFLLDSESRIRAALSGNAPVSAAGHEGPAERPVVPTSLPGGTASPEDERGTGADPGGHQHGGN
jgi:multidrug efflux pump subunit AcrA (membrane-fusion protein)